jgi:hypothetical protein
VRDAKKLQGACLRLMQTLHDPEGIPRTTLERFSRADRTSFVLQKWGQPHLLTSFQKVTESLQAVLQERPPSQGGYTEQKRKLPSLLEKVLFPTLRGLILDRFVLMTRWRMSAYLAITEMPRTDRTLRARQEQKIAALSPKLLDLLHSLLLSLRPPSGTSESPHHLALRAFLTAFHGRDPPLVPEIAQELLRGLPQAPPSSRYWLQIAALDLLCNGTSFLSCTQRHQLLQRSLPALDGEKQLPKRIGLEAKWIYAWVENIHDCPRVPPARELQAIEKILSRLESSWELNPGAVALYAYWANNSLSLFTIKGRGNLNLKGLKTRLFKVQKKASLRLGDPGY